VPNSRLVLSSSFNCIDFGCSKTEYEKTLIGEHGVKKLGILTLAVLGVVAVFAAEFPAPQPKRINVTGHLDCVGIVSTVVMEKGGKFIAEVDKSTDHLAIKRVGKSLEVTALHTPPDKKPQTDVYQITADTRDYLSAVQHPGMLPTVHGIVINKRLGTAIWTESDAEFVLVSEQPNSDTVVLACSDVVGEK
jgi:hypothetical protein